jgi:hypothetical protein
MRTTPSHRRVFLLSAGLASALLLLCAGTGCPSNAVVVPDTFGIDLVNDTDFEVDPGVSVDQFPLDLGTLGPLEGSDVPVAFDVDCLPGDTLTIDPILFLPDTDALAANGPIVLEEGIDYFCGDILTLEFSQDAAGTFFVDVAVNGTFITF